MNLPRSISMTALIVEENAALCLRLNQAFQHLGFQVVEVQGNHAALASIWQHQGKFDLAWIDMHSSSINGPRIIESLRTLNPWIQAILCRLDAGSAPSPAMEDQGLIFLSNDFTLEELQNKLDTAFDNVLFSMQNE